MQKVYDDEQTDDKAKSGRLPMSDEVRRAETAQLESMYNSPSSEAQAEIDALDRQYESSPDTIREAEEEAKPGIAAAANSQEELDRVGAGYTGESTQEPKSRALKLAVSKRNKLIGGTTIGGILLGMIMSAFIALPLKVQHIANNLQQEFYASVDEATQRMLETLARNYITDYLVPGMIQNNCTSTLIDKNCVNVNQSTNIVGVHYRAWADARFESSLADKGIVFSRDESGFTLTTPTTTIDMGSYDPKNPKAFKDSTTRKMSKREFRREFFKAIDETTHSSRVFYRLKALRLLRYKYNIPGCVVACETRDKLSTLQDNVKDDFFVYVFLERVVSTYDEGLALAMECATRAFDCADTTPIEVSDDPAKPPERRTRLEIEFREKRAAYLQRVVGEGSFVNDEAARNSLREESSRLKTDGMLERSFKKIMGDSLIGAATSSAVLKAIPVVGWIDTGVTILLSAKKMGPAAVKFNAVINGAIVAQQWGLLRTNADEIKTGKAGLRETGSVATALSPSDGVTRTDQGGAGAEASPLYGAIMGQGASSNTASLLPKVSAASSGYVCEDLGNKPPPDGELVCPVERLDTVQGPAAIATQISDVANSPLLAPLQPIGEVWQKTKGIFGKLYDKTVGSVVDAMVGAAAEKVAAAAKPVFEAVGTILIKPMLTGDLSAARFFHGTAAGADLTGNYVAHYGLGAAKVTDEQAQAIRTEREQERYEEFQGRSMFARIFSTDTKYSLVSKAAIATPLSNSGGVPSSFLGVVSNPVGAFTSGFASVFSGSKAGAATTGLTKDPFGITQYAYTDDNPVFLDDPEKYWVENDCDNPKKHKAWGERAVENPITGMPEHAPGDTNGCMLLRSAINAGSGLYTDDTFTEAEKADIAGTSSGSSDPGTPSACYSVSKLTGQKIQGRMFHQSGSQTYAFENSPAGIRFAANHHYDSIDLDLRLTKDGIPVATHWERPIIQDGFFDPQNKIRKNANVNEMTFDEISRLRNRDGQSQIYSLEEMARVLAENNMKLSLELKVPGLADKMSEIAEILNEYKVGTIIKADARQAALSEALTTARKHGFWTRGTKSSQDWKAPDVDCSSLPGADNAAAGSNKMYDDYKTECNDYRDAAGEPDCLGREGGGQCVDFVQFRLKKHINRDKFSHIGASAKDVADELRRIEGYRSDNTPALNSVAVWPAGGVAGSSANSDHGHVAMVSEVVPGKSITVEEYNAVIPALTYSTRTIPWNVAVRLKFVHTEGDFK